MPIFLYRSVPFKDAFHSGRPHPIMTASFTPRQRKLASRYTFNSREEWRGEPGGMGEVCARSKEGTGKGRRVLERYLGIVGHLVVGCRTGARRIVPSINKGLERKSLPTINIPLNYFKLL